MSKIADRISERLSALGLSERDASLRATGSPNTLRTIRTGASKNPRIDTIEKIAEVLETTPEWLTGASEEKEPNGTIAPNVAAPTQFDAPRDIPLLGTAAGALDHMGAVQINDEPIDYVKRPHGIPTARGIYALYVDGDSMFPKYKHGDLIFVSSFKPPQIGDTVVIQQFSADNGGVSAFVKLLKERRNDTIVTAQYNPADVELTFPNARELKVHKVLENNELYGV